PDGIELGTRGAIRLRSAGLSKTGPTQLDLGGAAFAPKFVPFKTDCEVWRTNLNSVPPPAVAPAPEATQWPQGTANSGAVQSAPPAPAPAPEGAATAAPQAPGGQQDAATDADTESSSSAGGFFSRLFDRSTIHVHENDPANAPKDIKLPSDSDGKDGNNYVTDPIQLANPSPCNWAMPDFDLVYQHRMEIAPYFPWEDEHTHYLKPNGDWVLMGSDGSAYPTKFNVEYDDQMKTLTASVKVGVFLKDLYEIDPATSEPKKLPNGSNKSVPYDSTANGANSKNDPNLPGFRTVGRDKTDYDFLAKSSTIAETLNQNSYKLILDGCSKGAACGCRISVKFKVAFVVLKSQADPQTAECNKVINLYPYASRDDSANWGEVGARFDLKKGGYVAFGADYTAAHECGHLFNLPDEYYSAAGAVHEQYVVEQQLQFAKGHLLAGASTWQIDSQINLMGHGARTKVASGVKPTIPPYYMEYLRRWMTQYTNKKWRIGIQGK
ncbi:hypothetical protein AB4Y32_40205, partial [Paraburkholderia phymatum]